MADQYSLTDEEKEYALVKAHEQHGERLAQAEEACGSDLDVWPSATNPSEALRLRYRSLRRRWSR